MKTYPVGTIVDFDEPMPDSSAYPHGTLAILRRKIYDGTLFVDIDSPAGIEVRKRLVELYR